MGLGVIDTKTVVEIVVGTNNTQDAYPSTDAGKTVVVVDGISENSVSNPNEVESIDWSLDEDIEPEPEGLWREPSADASFSEADELAAQLQDRIRNAVDSDDEPWMGLIKIKYDGLPQSFRELIAMGVGYERMCRLNGLEPKVHTFKMGELVRHDRQFWKISKIRADGRLDLDHNTLQKATSADPSEVELVGGRVAA